MPTNPQSLTPQCWFVTADGIILAVKAQPGAKRTAVGAIIESAPAPGWPPGRLKVAVSAPPEDGRANEAILAALAKYFQIKPAAITLETGSISRDKKFRLIGDPARLLVWLR
ncbi:MAG: hypothetical protein B7Z81_13490 [Acidocella sp. 20-61-6]|nr:MAG: hypothetical protein B7Z81_13490 [Acidocella sp. 20-61-6]